MAISDRDDPRLTYLPLARLIIPPSGIVCHYQDHWWITDTERGAVFYSVYGNHAKESSPQCNSDKSLIKLFAEQMYPWAEIVFLPSAFIKVKPSDYQV
jgi:hypothetical protein